MDYAGFWIRFAAFFIDSIILTVLFVPIVSPVLFFGGFSTFSELMTSTTVKVDLSLFSFDLNLLVFVIKIAYFAIMESSSKQATLGKIILGIKVVREDGSRITLMRGIGRYLAKTLSAILYVGYIMAGLTAKKKALHDFVAKTYVVKK